MRLTRIAQLLRRFWRLSVAQNTSSFASTTGVPSGLVADNSAELGLLAFMANSNQFDSNSVTAIAGGASTALTFTAAQFLSNVISYSGSPGGGVTFTTPTAAQIIAALPPTIPKNGFSFLWAFVNDASGQTVTIAGGTNVTVAAKTPTVATDTTRLFICNININAGTVTLLNLGGGLTL